MGLFCSTVLFQVERVKALPACGLCAQPPLAWDVVVHNAASHREACLPLGCCSWRVPSSEAKSEQNGCGLDGFCNTAGPQPACRGAWALARGTGLLPRGMGAPEPYPRRLGRVQGAAPCLLRGVDAAGTCSVCHISKKFRGASKC